MSMNGDEQVAQDQQGPQPGIYPLCPYCRTEPGLRMMPSMIETGGGRVAVFTCGDCRAVLSMQLVAVEPTRVQAPGSGIIIPQ